MQWYCFPHRVCRRFGNFPCTATKLIESPHNAQVNSSRKVVKSLADSIMYIYICIEILEMIASQLNYLQSFDDLEGR